MKVLHYLSFVVFFCLTFLQLSAHDVCTRLYLNPENIMIDADAIHVEINGELLPVTQLNVDSNGIYVIIGDYKAAQTWICSSCGFENPWYATSCCKCGWN